MLYQRYWWKLAALTLSSILGSQMSWADARGNRSFVFKDEAVRIADGGTIDGSDVKKEGTDLGSFGAELKSPDANVKSSGTDAKPSDSDAKSSEPVAKPADIDAKLSTDAAAAATSGADKNDKNNGGVMDKSLTAPGSQSPVWLREMRAARRIQSQNGTLALMLFKKAFADAVEANAPAKDRLNIALDIGELQFSESLLPEAIASYKRGEEIAVIENRKDWQAAFLGREGLAASFAYSLGQSDKKPNAQPVLKALELRPGEPNVPTSFRAMCYQALSQIYLANDDLVNAEKYTSLGIAECAQLGDEKGRGDGLKAQKAILMLKAGKLSAGLKYIVQLISQDTSNSEDFGSRFKKALIAEDSSGKDLRNKVKQLFAAKSFSELDKYIDQLRAKKEADAQGYLAEQSVYNFLDLASGESDSAWQKRIDDAKTWVKENPKSAAAKILLGDLLVSYAWKARGSGYANTISVDGQRLFDLRLRQSLDSLVAVPLEARPGAWYPVVQRVAMGQGWTAAHYNQLVAEGIKKHPDCLQILFAKSYWLQPRWYGAEGEADKFIAAEVAKKSGEDADILYARFQWYLDEIIGNITSDTKFDYARMKRGLEALCRRYPQSWKARAELFYVAIRENDKQSALSIPKVGK